MARPTEFGLSIFIHLSIRLFHFRCVWREEKWSTYWNETKWLVDQPRRDCNYPLEGLARVTRAPRPMSFDFLLRLDAHRFARRFSNGIINDNQGLKLSVRRARVSRGKQVLLWQLRNFVTARDDDNGIWLEKKRVTRFSRSLNRQCVACSHKNSHSLSLCVCVCVCVCCTLATMADQICSGDVIERHLR